MQPDPPTQPTPPPVVSCDFVFEDATSIRQVCQGRTVDATLAVENAARGQFVLTLFIPGTSLQALQLAAPEGFVAPKILKRVTPREEADQLEIHFAHNPRRAGGFSCRLEKPAMTLRVTFPLTRLETPGAGQRPRPHGDRPSMSHEPGMTVEFMPDLPPLPPEPMTAVMQPAMDPPPPMVMTGGDLPPDPE
jgi:hypothetical protein